MREIMIRGSLCGDVRSVLQEVFRESSYLPPLDGVPPEAGVPDVAAVQPDPWMKCLSLQSAKLNNCEEKLQQEYAKRLAKDTLPNIYTLQSISVYENQNKWKEDLGLLERRDLKPTLLQDATRDESLWLKNTLHRSSGNISTLKITGSKIKAQATLQLGDEMSVQSISWGELASALPAPSLLSSSNTPSPDYIICIPPQLQFINFKIGQLYTQSLRLINVSKFEMRLSIRPLKHRELDVQLCSRLVVTSGSAAELKIHFRPNDVRILCDKLLVRVSSGQTLYIPIECYMVPPILDIIVSTIKPRLSSPDYIITVQDVLDMGARLLGDSHHSLLVLRCGEHHATFFLLSEEAWLEYSVEVAINSIEEISTYGVLADCFFVSPVTWSGGGTIRGFAFCRAQSPGLHTAVLKILCSTGIVRPLHLVADALLFSTKHITLQAHDKDYDVCSEDDPACEYYVHLGTTFPKCSLSAAVTVVNHSPVSYNYYWSVRPWGVCSCWKLSNDSRESEDRNTDLCPGALDAKLKETLQDNNVVTVDEDSLAVRVEQVRGRLSPRQDVVLTVRVPDVAETLGVRRAVLMLVLTDIPKESFPADYDPMVINVNVVEEEAIPGISPRLTREVCEVVCAEMEVWWEVVPIRFVLDPPLILVPYSRRMKSVSVTLRATQLYGVTSVQALWEMKTPAPAPPLFPGQPSFTTVTFPLKELPNEFPETSYIRLMSEKAEWSASSSLQSWSSQRALALRQARVWLGVLPPGAPVAATLIACNDTHQHIYWSATCHRWYRERAVAKACVGRPPCAVCFSRACTCSSLTPYRGALNCTQQISIKYHVNAPDTDGCVATLVQVRRTAKDGCQPSGSGGSCAASGSGGSSGSQTRASLIAYRVLAPRVTVAVLSCGEDESQECECCVRGVSGGLGGRVRYAALPRAALVVGDRRRFCLQVTNISPIPSRVHWEQAMEREDYLKVTFIPTEFDLGSYSRVTVVVLLEARRVSARRLAVRRARVLHAPRPLYLLLDVSVSGVEVVAEFPIGGGELTATSVSVKMMQKDLGWRMSIEEPTKEPLHPFQLFAEDDRKRARQKVNICECRYEMRYVAPTKAPRPPRGGSDDHLPVEIVEEPPPLTRTCPCSGRARPALPDHGEPYCLQFTNVPVRTVRSRSVYLRNVCELDARWRGAVRRFPREHTRTVSEDPWAGDVRAPGVLVALTPARGSLRARGFAQVSVAVYADCWGLYYDQILFQVEDLEPLVIDVWVEVVGAPLCLAPALWMSKSDADRVIRVSNTSRADLVVFAYVLRDNEYPREWLPFRLYLRLFDVDNVTPRTCPCLAAVHSNSTIEEESCGSGFDSGEMDTGVELFLAPDCGLQDDTFYQVVPSAFSLDPRERASLQVRLLPSRAPRALAPACSVLLRCVPVNSRGSAWCRPPPPAQSVALREAARGACLSCSCSEIRVALCALDMPVSDVVRIRKRFNLRNVGEGALDTTAITELPWRLDVSRNICSAHCKEVTGTYAVRAEVHLPPRSSAEMVAVLTLKTVEVWPRAGEAYPPRTITSTALSFYDQEDVVLFSIPLTLDLDTPVLSVRPELLDLGSASDGGAAKSHFTVTHSSSSAVIDLVTSWSGDDDFRIWPSSLSLRPGVGECVHVQYTARWSRGGVSAGWVLVRCSGAGGAWCGAVVQVRATVARSRSHNIPATPHSE